MRTLKVSLVSMVLSTSSLFALPFLDVEFGGMLGADFRDGGHSKPAAEPATSASQPSLNVSGMNNTKLAYGAYCRAWIGSMIKLSPFVKYEAAVGMSNANVDTSKNVKVSLNRYQNMQYGGAVGFRFPIIGLVPYAGASYSRFLGEVDLDSTWALNYGVNWEIPLIPALTLGVDASHQRPKVMGTDKRAMLNRIQATIGLQF